MSPPVPFRDRVPELARREYPDLEALYRELHAHPELSGLEKETAARMGAELGRSGLVVHRGIGGHGVVGVLENGPGPAVMIRCDMDALPVTEMTGLPYASTVMTSVETRGVKVGVMHACGHDLHMAILAGAVRLLAATRDTWSGTLLAVVQPAEETGAGARAMVRDGIFTRFPRPVSALALHVDPNIPAGKIGYRPGIISAGSTSLDVTVRGIGGHAAHPHQSIDPVVLAARVVLALQTIVSREIDPREMAVLTVGAIHGGTKHNAIPDEVVLRVNIRYNSDAVRDRMLASIDRIVKGIALSAGVPEELAPVIRRPGETTPPMVNDPLLTEQVREILASVLGAENVLLIPQLTGSEDFSVFSNGSPAPAICYLRLGAADPRDLEESRKTGRDLPYLHSSRFAPPPDPTIRVGAIALAAAVNGLLAPR
ncbi:MAG TPA: amidohydrolase [Methanomicrobiales archaeon]|nr:amidohydrolase [Methanomicrobiales archaeon]